jgi:hypothetical protein
LNDGKLGPVCHRHSPKKIDEPQVHQGPVQAASAAGSDFGPTAVVTLAPVGPKPDQDGIYRWALATGIPRGWYRHGEPRYAAASAAARRSTAERCGMHSHAGRLGKNSLRSPRSPDEAQRNPGAASQNADRSIGCC